MNKVIILLVFSLCSYLAVSAEKPYDDNLKLFIAGDLKTLVTDMETEKDIDMYKGKLKLGQKNAVLYAAALLANGEVLRLAPYLELAREKYPKNIDLREMQKQLDIYREKAENEIEALSDEERSQIRLLDLFMVYYSMKGAGDQEGCDLLKVNLMAKINKVSNRLIYFPGQIEYLLELQDPSLYDRVRSDAQEIITKNQSKLFPTSVDNYELALAYRALAILAEREEKSDEAESYYKLSYNEVLKMRSYWIEEDIMVYRRILKMTSRRTKLGYVLPQYIMILRERFKPAQKAESVSSQDSEANNMPSQGSEAAVAIPAEPTELPAL